MFLLNIGATTSKYCNNIVFLVAKKGSESQSTTHARWTATHARALMRDRLLQYAHSSRDLYFRMRIPFCDLYFRGSSSGMSDLSLILHHSFHIGSGLSNYCNNIASELVL